MPAQQKASTLPTLNAAQIYLLWRLENPNSEANPTVMTAIALAESSGRSGVVNSIGACGLWQIHPYQPGCEDFRTNAKQAQAKYETQGYGAWQSYTEGSYRAYLPEAERAEKLIKKYEANPKVQSAGLAGDIGILEEITTGFGLGPEIEKGLFGKTVVPQIHAKGIAEGVEGFGELINFISHGSGWARIGKVVLGAGLVLIAIAELIKVGTGSEGPNPVTRTAKKAAGLGLAIAVPEETVAAKTAKRVTEEKQGREQAKKAAKQATESASTPVEEYNQEKVEKANEIGLEG